MTTYHTSPRYRFQRIVLRAIFRFIFRVLYRIRITGLENVPASGGYILVHNHVSVVEPPFIASFWPISIETIGTEELWERPGQGWIIRFYGTIRVGRQRAMDRAFLKQMVTLLKTGYPLLIAPEGGRSHTKQMKRAEPGVAYLADQAQAPVLPVGVVGSQADALKLATKGKRPVLEMIVGRPFSLPPLNQPAADGKRLSRREARQRNADLVMQEIAALLPEEYHGEYGR